MTDNDRTRANLTAIVDEIARLERALVGQGLTLADIRDPADREVYDIVCRIERKARQQAA